MAGVLLPRMVLTPHCVEASEQWHRPNDSWGMKRGIWGSCLEGPIVASLPVGSVVAEVEIPPVCNHGGWASWLGTEALGLAGAGDFRGSPRETGDRHLPSSA